MFLYNLVVTIYGFFIRLASLRKHKAKQWMQGRARWRERYEKMLLSLPAGKRVWIHCASYGEFEQGRPLIEGIKKHYPEHMIILTFFSPSGYEAFKEWEGANLVMYLPLDTRRNARDFISIVKPEAAIFIKYEFWLNLLRELKRNNIPTYLVSAIFVRKHIFFQWYGGIFRSSLQAFRRIFLQDQASGFLLNSIGITHYEVTGDTRFDRVMQIKNNFSGIPYIQQFCSNKRIIIGGSTWPKDEDMMIEACLKLNRPEIKMILVPHEVDEGSIDTLLKKLEEKKLTWLRYSEHKTPTDEKVLVIDTIGLLSRIYYYGDVAYIGGGFTNGLHNVLEPAVFGLPVTFYGDNKEKFNEVGELLELDAARNVFDADELAENWNELLKENKQKEVAEKLETYFHLNANVTERILDLMHL